jgi:hypothetical protein
MAKDIDDSDMRLLVIDLFAVSEKTVTRSQNQRRYWIQDTLVVNALVF